MARKEFQFWTVRCKQGFYMGTYRATTPTAAIDTFLRDQNIMRSQFRRSMRGPSFKAEDFTAAVENK
jgi:hypothetical protein